MSYRDKSKLSALPGLAQWQLGYPLRGTAWFFLITIGYIFGIIPGLILHMIAISDARDLANLAR